MYGIANINTYYCGYTPNPYPKPYPKPAPIPTIPMLSYFDIDHSGINHTYIFASAAPPSAAFEPPCPTKG
jgi:hypothetical protein